MPNKTIIMQASDYFGGSTFIASILLNASEWFGIANFNDTLLMLSSIGGLIFITYKVIILRKDSKLKDIEIKERLKKLGNE